jgi:UDP-N-acetylglucosamine 2-epimerase (non-hydrolysing)
MDNSRLLITDSGGIQEETTALGVPCLTVRDNTERAVTIREGTNELIGVDPAKLEAAVERVLSEDMPSSERIPAQWDGHAGERIIDDLVGWLEERNA